MAVSAVHGRPLKTRTKTSINGTYMKYATWPEIEVMRRSGEYHEGVIHHRHHGLRTPILAASVRSCCASIDRERLYNTRSATAAIARFANCERSLFLSTVEKSMMWVP
jgi:hypothetical protein